MEQLRGYLVAIVAVCMICVIAGLLVRGGLPARITRLAGGLLVLLAVAVPLLRLDLSGLTERLEEYWSVRDFDAEEYTRRTQKALREQLAHSAEKLIVEYAAELDAQVTAEVTVSTDDIPEPLTVTVTGTLDEEQLRALSAYLRDAIGIAPSRQKWRLHETEGS